MRARVDRSDVVQAAQLEASRRLESYSRRPEMPFRLWLWQIAYDRLLMLRRRHIDAARRTVARDLPLPDRSSVVLAQQLLSGDPRCCDTNPKRSRGKHGGLADASG